MRTFKSIVDFCNQCFSFTLNYSRFQEVFAALKSVQPPNINNPLQNATEKKVQEQFRTIRLLFKRLRLLFDKCNDSCQQGEIV